MQTFDVSSRTRRVLSKEHQRSPQRPVRYSRWRFSSGRRCGFSEEYRHSEIAKSKLGILPKSFSSFVDYDWTQLQTAAWSWDWKTVKQVRWPRYQWKDSLLRQSMAIASAANFGRCDWILNPKHNTWENEKNGLSCGFLVSLFHFSPCANIRNPRDTVTGFLVLFILCWLWVDVVRHPVCQTAFCQVISWTISLCHLDSVLKHQSVSTGFRKKLCALFILIFIEGPLNVMITHPTIISDFNWMPSKNEKKTFPS